MDMQKEKGVKYVKYPLTAELRSNIQETRQFFDLTTQELSYYIEMNKETYNNIERKKSSTTTISSVVLDKLFNVFCREENYRSGENLSADKYIIRYLDNLLYNTGYSAETLEEQHWLKAFYLKYDTITLTEEIRKQFLSMTDADLTDMLRNLQNNRHIKLKTDIVVENEVYINLNKNKYPDLGGHPFWCIKYGEFSQEEINSIITDKNNGYMKYSLLFALLVNKELESRRKKDYQDVYATVYSRLNTAGIFSIFDKINKIKKVKEPAKIETTDSATFEVSNAFYDMLKDFDTQDCPENAKQLIKNCLDGKENFLNSINIDFSPLFNASTYDVEIFKIRLKELLDTLFQ